MINLPFNTCRSTVTETRLADIGHFHLLLQFLHCYLLCLDMLSCLLAIALYSLHWLIVSEC